MLQTFTALGEPNRLRIVELLTGGARPVGEICDRLGLQQPQASKHLKVLRGAGLVRVEPRGQQRVYALAPEPFDALGAWLAERRALWADRFDALDALLTPPPGDAP